jgi:hypothetical protein
MIGNNFTTWQLSLALQVSAHRDLHPTQKTGEGPASMAGRLQLSGSSGQTSEPDEATDSLHWLVCSSILHAEKLSDRLGKRLAWCLKPSN